MIEICLTCRNSIYLQSWNKDLCKHCKDGSNFEHTDEDSLESLAVILKNEISAHVADMKRMIKDGII